MAISDEAIIGLLGLVLMCAVPIIGLLFRAKFRRPSADNAALSLTGPLQRSSPQPTQGATWIDLPDIEAGRPIDFIMVRRKSFMLSWNRDGRYSA